MAGKKIVALTLVTGYFLSVACRFVCAEMMAASPRAESPVAVGSDEAMACHHHASKPEHKRHGETAPCCMTDSGSPALVNAFVVAPSPARGLNLGVIAYQPAAGITAEPRAFGTDSSPPLVDCRAVFLSALSSRAPPSLPVVL